MGNLTLEKSAGWGHPMTWLQIQVFHLLTVAGFLKTKLIMVIRTETVINKCWYILYQHVPDWYIL